MTNPFERILKRRPQAQAVQPGASPQGGTIQVYEALFIRRGISILLLALWTPLALGVLVMMFLFEGELNAIPYSTGLRVLLAVLVLSSIAFVPLLVPTSRRRWVLFADRVEISERPLVPGFGRRRSIRLRFTDIRHARMGESLNADMPTLELESRDGRRFGLRPNVVGKGRDARLDTAGFDRFVETIRQTILASGAPLPAGEELKTATSGFFGIVVLAGLTAFFGALAIAGLVIVVAWGEPVGLQMVAFMAPFALMFGGWLMVRWRKWRALR